MKLIGTMCVAVALLEHSAVGSDSKDALIDRIVAHWESQASAISSARIRYRCARTSGRSLRPLAPAEVNAILESLNLPAHPDDLGTLARRVVSLDVSLPEKPWAIFDFFQQGELRREDIDLHGSKRGQVRGGEQDILIRNSGKQVSLFLAGGSRQQVADIRSFREVPRIKKEDLILVQAENRPGVAIVQLGKTEFDVDPTNGFVSRWVHHAKDGSVDTEASYLDARTYPGDILFPTAVVLRRFRNNSLYYISATVIEEAFFNEDLPAQTFEVGSPAGGLIVDHRANATAPRQFVTREPVRDVVKYTGRVSTISTPSRTRYLWIAITLGSILVLLILMYRKRRIRAAIATQ